MTRALLIAAAMSGMVASLGCVPAPAPAGKAAPAAGTFDPHDLQGLWVISNRSQRGYRDENLQPLQDYLTPAAAKTRAAIDVALDPSARCMTMFPRQMGWPYPLQIVQTPAVTLILFEADQVFRQIHTDGRSWPGTDEQRWMGYSIGHWEGDTLVVQTSKFNLRNDWHLMEYFCAEGNRDNVFDQKEGQKGSLKLSTPQPKK
jgi:hypothetical protein